MIDKKFDRFLGGIERNTSGHIVGAKATFINWFSEAEITTSLVDGHTDPSRQGMLVDIRVIQFFYFNQPMPKEDSQYQTKHLLLKPFCIWLQIRSSPMILSYYIKADLLSN